MGCKTLQRQEIPYIDGMFDGQCRSSSQKVLHLRGNVARGESQGAEAKRDESKIRHQHETGMAKFVCAEYYGDELLFVGCCDQQVCDDHSLKQKCCVCSGNRRICVRCGIKRWHRCSRELLCVICSWQEGWLYVSLIF